MVKKSAQVMATKKQRWKDLGIRIYSSHWLTFNHAPHPNGTLSYELINELVHCKFCVPTIQSSSKSPTHEHSFTVDQGTNLRETHNTMGSPAARFYVKPVKTSNIKLCNTLRPKLPQPRSHNTEGPRPTLLWDVSYWDELTTQDHCQKSQEILVVTEAL